MYSKFQCISRFHHEVMCHLEHVTLFYYIVSEEKLTRSGSEEKLNRSGHLCVKYGITSYTSVTVATTQTQKEVMSLVPVYPRVL